MNKLTPYTLMAAMGLAGAAIAQVQQTPPSQTPSTSQSEGAAGDRITPGESPTQATTPRYPDADPRPSTNVAEGTAADRTPLDNTSITSGGKTAKTDPKHGNIIGATVVTPDDAPLGKIVDVVFESAGQPSFVVIASQGKSAAVPYSTATAMKSGDKIVIDKSRLDRAPKIKEGEWRSQSDTWKNDSTRYWDRS